MYSRVVLSVLSLTLLTIPVTQAAETILGVYIFSRHGDRTDKSHAPANLTDLGYHQVFSSGQFYRDQYVSSTASSKILGIQSQIVKNSQLLVQAPDDLVIMNSAQGFLQGLYPPVGASISNQKLNDGNTIQPPMNGYQLIPLHMVTTGTGSEDNPWLQGAFGCSKATVSSNAYYSSKEYLDLKAQTDSLYQSLTPFINGTFSDAQTSYKNAYTIWDLLTVASIHNASFTPPPPETQSQLFSLASTQQFALGYNASSPVRAIAGATLASQVLLALNTTITAPTHSPRLNIQFGAYSSILSFFGLAQLPVVSPAFAQIPDYASTMTFELFTTAPTTPFPATSDISVRFLWHNGTITSDSKPSIIPLFGRKETSLPWTTFIDEMRKFAVGTQEKWCDACGNSTGVCVRPSTASTPSDATTSSQINSPQHTSHRMGKVVAGVVGAMVTLAVILGLEALILLVAGLRIVKRHRAGNHDSQPSTEILKP